MKSLAKGLLVVAITIFLFAVSMRAYGMTPQELIRGNVVEKGLCSVNVTLILPCMEIEVKGKNYVIFLDENYKAIVIFEGKGKKPYDFSNQKPIWERSKIHLSI